jgi:putative inorganic carbon (HCO3(-)) transporter
MVPGFNALSAYSVPLEIAVEQGVPGLLIFTSLVIVLQLRAWLTLDRETVSLQKVVLVAFILAGINGMLVFGLFDTIWYRPAINLLFWLWVGWLALLSEPPQPSLEKES